MRDGGGLPKISLLIFNHSIPTCYLFKLNHACFISQFLPVQMKKQKLSSKSRGGENIPTKHPKSCPLWCLLTCFTWNPLGKPMDENLWSWENGASFCSSTLAGRFAGRWYFFLDKGDPISYKSFFLVGEVTFFFNDERQLAVMSYDLMNIFEFIQPRYL